MNQPPRQSRILWEARPDPAAARRLARPIVAIGWIVLVCSVFTFAGQLVTGRDGAAPPISASLAEHAHRIEEVRIDTHELRGLAIRTTLFLLLFAMPCFLAPTIAAAVARQRRAPFGELPSSAGQRVVLVRDDLPDGTCRALLVFPEPVPSGRRPKPVLHIRGPFRSEDADRGEDILRRELGLPPRDTAESAFSVQHAFPPWMTLDERARLAAKLAPGERLLWVGRPVERVAPFAWLAPLMGVFLAYMAYMALSKLPGSGILAVIRESVPVWTRQLFTGEFGATGIAYGVAWAVVIIGSVVIKIMVFVFWLLLPWFSRRTERRRRFLVTNRRAWTIPGAAQIRAFAPEVFPPTVCRAGSGRSNVFFLPIGNSVYDAARASHWRSLGFINLPDADIPAALAALEELRRSATPSSAEEFHAENAESAEPDPSTRVAP